MLDTINDIAIMFLIIIVLAFILPGSTNKKYHTVVSKNYYINSNHPYTTVYDVNTKKFIHTIESYD